MLHASVWILLFLIPFLLQQSADHGRQEHKPVNHAFTYLAIFSDALYIMLFYFNAYIMVPGFFYKKKYWAYFFFQLLIISSFCVLQMLFFEFFINQPFRISGFFFFNLFPYLFIIACSITYRVIQDRVELERINNERENENLKTELTFLRSQVNPHFMFNVLNNMVALARKKSDLLEPSLIKLSSLLRYMLYETDEQKVPLEKEVEYLRSYIDLQQQRFGSMVKLNVNIQPPDRSYEIEPMLLIPFVENAFKHGTGIIDAPQIDINLRAEKDVLEFIVSNKYNPDTKETKDDSSGIGLSNVKRRLNLLYSKNHSLAITDNDNWFKIVLQIKLQ